jgi:RNA polymerase sigma-70 factor (ECF subfamily)
MTWIITSQQMHTEQASRSLRGMVADDDTTLMLQYAGGDMSAFERLYARHKTALYRYLHRVCRDGELANDVFQETWGKVIDGRGRYEARTPFKPWLFRIAHNCAVDHLRRLNRWAAREGTDIDEVAELMEDSAQQRPEQQLSTDQFVAEFQGALDDLPDEQRAVFVMHEESGLALADIATVVNCNAETAKSRLRYAIRKLRQALSKFDPERDTDNRTAAGGRRPAT